MSLSDVQQIALTIGAVGAALGALWGGLLAARRLPPFAWDWLQSIVDHRRAKAQRERDLSKLIEMLPEIRAELKPNSGSSFRDQVDRIGRTVETTGHEVEHLSSRQGELEREVGALGAKVDHIAEDLGEHVRVSTSRAEHRDAFESDAIARLGRLEAGREGA